MAGLTQLQRQSEKSMCYRLQKEEALAVGVRRIAREELDDALDYLTDSQEQSLDEAVYESRKSLKKLCGLLRLVRPIWPGLMKQLAAEIHDLSDYLGDADAYDLAELQRLVAERPLILNDPNARESFIAFLQAEREKLHAAAYHRGQCIYAESPNKFIKRMKTYWQVSLV